MRDMEAAAETAARLPLRTRTIVLGLLAGTIVGGIGLLLVAPPRGARFESRLAWSEAAPLASDWPRAAREGETAAITRSGGQVELVVTAGSAGVARELTRAFAARFAPTKAELATHLEPLRETWRRAAPAAAPARSTRATDAAALLLARARWGEELAAELPMAVPVGAERKPAVPPEVEDAWLNVTWVVDERDPALLRQALVDAARVDRAWFADSAAWHGWTRPARAQAWRDWQHQRTRLLEPLASGLMTWEGGAQRQALESAGAFALVSLDRDLGDPWEPFATPAVAPVRPLVRPIAGVWLPPLLMGAGGGALAAMLLLVLAALLQPGFPRSPALRAALGSADPAAIAPPLHVVSGASPALMARAALELAAQRVALGDRVLIVDASPRLRMHERLGRDARWGLLECLAAEMPVLGLVQYGGHPGLHLLPHGRSTRAVSWSLLGRMLDELLPNFPRIVLAVDPDSPNSLGDALRGRPMEGWWAGTERRHGRGAEDAMGRLGIALNPLALSGMPEASLEAMVARVAALRPAGPQPEPAPITAPVALEPPVLPRPVLEPIVLDCDLQVMQRLRFLAWMRRVQSEDRREGAQAES